MDTLNTILKRVEKKKEDYATYGFEKLEMAALNTFFDLAQEYDGLENVYSISVAVPRVFFGFQCSLYVLHPKSESIEWVADSHPDQSRTEAEIPRHIKMANEPYHHGQAYVVPIHGRKTPASHILFHSSRDIIGIFEVVQSDQLTEAQLFFIEKYVNRIGYNLYNKFLAEQNIQHLKFINNLVADIEHNVIVPNIRYKYYFRKIRKFLNINKEIESELDTILEELKSQDPDVFAKMSEIAERMIVINRGIFNDQENIEQHYRHTSLFLESLFRPDHFLFGEYILKKTPCCLWEDIVLPQLERFRDRFDQLGIMVSHFGKDHEASKGINVRVDKGLLAQVVSNLFSNAVKYAEPVVDASGKKGTRVRCTVSLNKDFFGGGHNGVRFGVFSSGPPIDPEAAVHIFEEGFRVTESDAQEGTGHGLHFVKNVVEVHGGVVGYNPDELGNEFYFFVPA
ncbi:MAG: HAMP domain-containing histidine kinase [Deltaproteobacteria bacterium]|nr:HAMP domain-containing histidine kinase [Deltaproteobacteria bacterium]